MSCSSARGKYLLVASALLALLAAGCAIDVPTNPDTFSLEPTRASHLRGPQTVALMNAHEADARTKFPAGHGQTWIVGQQQLTETAIVMLRRSLEKQGITDATQAGKTVTLRVRAEHAFLHTSAWSPISHSNARLVLEVQFGDGTSTSIPAQNQSPMGAQRAFDGAVLFALNQLLIDEKFVAYMNRVGADPPKPAVSAATTPASASTSLAIGASTAASSVASPATTALDARFPQAGDSWTYRLTRRSNPKPRTYAIKVVYSSEARIFDQVSVDGTAPAEWSHASGRYLVTQGVSILSPYLAVFESPSGATALRNIVTRDDLTCRQRILCHASGEVIGQEIVRVPAGSFEALKVTVTQTWQRVGGTNLNVDAVRELTGWYAPQVKRFVKFSSRSKAGRPPIDDFDLELMTYQLK